MAPYVVKVPLLNLRGTPQVVSGNVLATLHQGQRVDDLGGGSGTWTRVRVSMAGAAPIDGYVASRHLAPGDGISHTTSNSGIQDVHFPPRAEARRASTEFRHVPIGEANAPSRASAVDAAANVAALHAIVDWLDVEQSARYAPANMKTYCNVYAYDVCWLAKAFLPRVWWTQKAIADLVSSKPVAVSYGVTVKEVNANGLYDWLIEWGPDFGWTRTFDLTDIQSKVNAGGIGVISAKRIDLSRSGHITVVMPEGDVTRGAAQRTGTTVTAPLQSQAGAKNHAYFNADWWVENAKQFQGTALWLHA